MIENKKINKSDAQNIKDMFNKRKIAKQELQKFISKTEKAFKNKDLNFLKRNTVNSLINDIKLDKIKKYNFKNYDFIKGKEKYEGNIAEVIFIVNMQDNSFYFKVKFIFESSLNCWKVYDFEELK